MKLSKTLIVLLAVFMLILSAGAVSADDTTDGVDFGEDDAADDAVDDDAADDADEGDEDEETDDVEDDDVEPADIGTPITAMADGADDATASAGDEAGSTGTSLDKHAAGNPVLVLLTAIAGIGLTTLRRR